MTNSNFKQDDFKKTTAFSKKFTPEQNQATSLRKCNLLVSAAAGSGKTAVLTERILKKILGDTHTPPIDIDHMLIVTFTKASAMEMKHRIQNNISTTLQEYPQNIHLQNQLLLLPKADIKTLHSFCLQIIKEYYYILDIDPAIRTIDTFELKLIPSSTDLPHLIDSVA